MRVKSNWFKAGSAKGATEVAGAAAFIAWRVAQNALKRMRGARFELAAGAGYFDFLAELLAFLVVGADRIAYRRRDGAWRVEFTTEMANRVGAILAENESDLLASASAEDIKRRFVALVNERAAECAAFAWDDAGPDYPLLRYLGHRVADVMDESERTWAVSQVIDVEAPEAAELLERAMAGLLDESPREPRRQRTMSGE
ncbi:MAG: hypothetical protein OEX23_11030 [Betaproteobacteria bacterium]|jgi:hypothetical protein|nr:hypothetical protein [Betaproteobacteria bacterium]